MMAEGIVAGLTVHVRDRVMTGCIEAVTIEQPDVMAVHPGKGSRGGEHIWVKVGGVDNARAHKSLIAADHWHYPEDCPAKLPQPPL